MSQANRQEISPLRSSLSEKPPFERFYEDNYFTLIRYLNRKTDSMAAAEDLAGETFFYCYEHYDSYDPEKSSPTTWLYLVANCRLKNYFRDRKPHSDFSEFEEWLFSSEPDMDKTVYLEQLREFLAEQLQLLPERQRQAIVLRYFREQSFEEIAVELQTTPGNIRTMISRTLTRMEKNISATKNDWRE